MTVISFKLNGKEDWIETLASLSIAILLTGGSCYHYHQRQVAHHEHIVMMANHQRYLRHKHLWQPVWNAKKHPTAHNLSKLTLNHPWGNSVMVVNHNHSTLNPKSWKRDHIHFSHKDKLGRVSYPATAYLARTNATGDALRKQQKVKPVGWHQHNFQGDWLLNRGHLVAYSISKDINWNGDHVNHPVGNQNDPNNLFTETELCNQQLQYTFETRIRMQLERNKRVIYRVQPIFRGNELMARGIHLQAISTDGKFQFNVYLFNVQSGVKFNYQTGEAVPDSKYQFKLPTKLIQNSEYMDDHDKYMTWQRKIMKMYDKHIITYQQAMWDESHILGNYIIRY